IVDGAIAVDRERRTVHLDGVAIELTPIEFDLYVALLDRRGADRRRDDLLYEVWGHRDGSGLRTVDSHVRSIRRKLGDDVVRTVHGVGYASRDVTP
ncbi:MAG: winged helix-turn-helix domain-containing protein, partial [Actinomycetota bacterium]